MRIIHILIIALCMLLLLACGGSPAEPAVMTTAIPAMADASAVTEKPAKPVDDTVVLLTTAPEQLPDAPIRTPEAVETAEPAETAEPTPAFVGNARLDAGEFDSYFDDAVFIGDSLTSYFKNYVLAKRNTDVPGYLGKAQFMSISKMSAKIASKNRVDEEEVNFLVRGRSTSLTEGIKQTGAKKAFLLLGLNDLGFRDWDETYGYFEKIVDLILERNPDVELIVQGVLPVRDEFIKNKTIKEFLKKENIKMQDFNIRLAALCAEKGITFLNFSAELEDENRELAKNYCSDGRCHLSPEGEDIWVRALRRFAAERMLGNVTFETP